MHRHVFGIAAVCIAARRAEFGAQVLVILARRPVDPADTDAVPRLVSFRRAAGFLDVTDHFMAGNDGQPGRGRSTLDLIEFGVADAAGRYANQYFMLGGHRLR